VTVRWNRNRPAWSLIVAFVAGVYVVAAASASIELSLRTHAICAEHGELVHLDHGGVRLDLPVAPIERSVDAFRSLDADAGESGHEHCSLFSHRPGDTVVADRHDVVERLVPPINGCLMVTREVVCSGPVVTDLAPKQSPPLV